MSPDEIRVYLKQAHPELIAEPRTNPDGWSFFDGVPQRGVNSNRILRAVRNGPHGVTQLKLAVTSRQSGAEKEIPFAGTEAELREYVEAELRLHHDQR
jgi:hypothetical protein